jgi:hypothetical protein
MSSTYKEPIFVGGMSGKLTQFTSANGATFADITTADVNGPVRIDSLSVSNDDTAAGVLQLKLSDGTNAYPVALAAVPANSLVNTGASAPLSLLAAANLAPFVGTDAAGNKFLELPQGWKLQAALVAAPTAGKTFNVQARWGVYAGA